MFFSVVLFLFFQPDYKCCEIKGIDWFRCSLWSPVFKGHIKAGVVSEQKQNSFCSCCIGGGGEGEKRYMEGGRAAERNGGEGGLREFAHWQ